MNEGKLIILLKNPEVGHVKTRLSRQIGEEAALAVYYRLISMTREAVGSVPQDKAVFYSRYVDREDNWDNEAYSKYLQQGDDVGERMYHAIATVLGEGYQKAVLIGTDIYGLTPEVLENAFRLLDDHDVVIGPAQDGGYYLIGMKKAEPSLFDLKYWSTADVFSETIRRVEQAGLTYARTRLLKDIDEAGDLEGTDLLPSDQ